MVVLAERAIENALNDALSLFRANLSTFVSDIFAQETSQNQSEITTWWQNSANQVQVQVGYNLTRIQAPQLAITQEPSQEVASRRFVGNVQYQTSTNVVSATTFEGLYAIHVFGPNQNWLLWMQALVKWALLMERQSLESSYGIMNQRLSLGALRPVPDSLKDVVFPWERTVFLAAQHEDTWQPVAGSSVTTASVTLSV